MNKKSLILGGIVVVAALAGGAWYFNRKPADASSLVLYGNVDLRQVSLAFNGSERIGRLDVEEGDRVKAGQVLGELDTRTMKLRAAQAQAQIAVREQALLRLKTGSRPEEVAQSRASVAAAQADAELAGQQ